MAKWGKQSHGAPRRVNHAAVANEGLLFSFGGYCLNENYHKRTPMDVHIFSDNGKWRKLQTAIKNEAQYQETPYQRYGHTAVAQGNLVYVWGGRNDSEGDSDTMYVFDISSGKWSRPVVTGLPPECRDGHSACVINDAMYVFGGFADKRDHLMNDVHRLDFNSMSWFQIEASGQLPPCLDFHSATSCGNNMIVFGGRMENCQGNTHNDKVYILDVNTNCWTQPATSGTIPTGRRSHAAFQHKEFTYIFGGFNGDTNLHFDDVHRFNSDTFTWEKVQLEGEGPIARRRPACCAHQNKAYIFGGLTPYGEEAANSELGLAVLSDLYIVELDADTPASPANRSDTANTSTASSPPDTEEKTAENVDRPADKKSASADAQTNETLQSKEETIVNIAPENSAATAQEE